MITWKKRIFSFTNLLFIIFLLIQLIPDKAAADPNTSYSVGFMLIIEALVIAVSLLVRKKETLHLFQDIIGFIYGFMILWTLGTAKFDLLNPSLFPAPGTIFAKFVEDFDKIAVNVQSSLAIIVQGYLLAIIIAIPLGLFLGWKVRVGNAATYISKFLGSIPPIVYIPYGIALLPTFRSVSVFVIFLATFWPVLASTMSGVLNVERKVIDSAKVLNVKPLTMLFSIMLPASLPQIFIGCNQGLSVSFILLTSAEMIGARNGMGYYVKNYSDLGDYTRTIVGLLVIGIVVSFMAFLFNRLQKFLLKWKR